MGLESYIFAAQDTTAFQVSVSFKMSIGNIVQTKRMRNTHLKELIDIFSGDGIRAAHT